MERHIVSSGLGTEECWSRLRSSVVGRVGITIDALPAVLPVFFGVIDETITFRTVPGTKLAAASSEAVVAFEVDGWDPDDAVGWSVLVQGIAREVKDTGLQASIRTLPLPGAGGEGEHDHFVTVSAQIVTGRRIRLAGESG